MCTTDAKTAGKQIVMNRRQLVAGLAAGTVVACTVNPETGRNQLMLVSEGQLAQLSQSAWADVKKEERVSNDPALNSQLRRVGSNITGAAGMGGQSWEYAVFDSDTKNAFVLPGRQVGFYKGIMDLADNDDQVATVLGHEVGHVTGRHAAERYSQNLAVTGVTAATAIALSQSDTQYKGEIAAVLGLGITFGYVLPYSRAHELEADQLGVRYMHDAGYNPNEAIRFWEKMAAEGGPRQPELLSTHPDPSTRIQRIRDYIVSQGWA
jgi:predicted Zn-dependent protease